MFAFRIYFEMIAWHVSKKNCTGQIREAKDMLFKTIAVGERDWTQFFWKRKNGTRIFKHWDKLVEGKLIDRFTYLDRQDRDLTDTGWIFFQKVLQIYLETFKLCLISWNMARVQSLWWCSLFFLAPPLSPQLAQKYWLNLHYRLRKTAESHSGWWQ